MPYKDPERQKEFQRRWKRNRTTELRKLKDNPCMDCGNIFHFAVMEWDHVRGIKHLNVTQMQHYSFQRVLEEIAKCDLVCANCHAMRTYLRSIK